MPNNVNNDLFNSYELESYTLSSFVNAAQTLHLDFEIAQSNHDHDAYEKQCRFLNFVITGQDDVERRQAAIDPLRDCEVDPADITYLRDFDSLIGFTRNIIIRRNLNIYPVSNPNDALKTSIHLERKIRRGNAIHRVPYHRIPNMPFGHFGNRHAIHIFFPSLWAQDRSTKAFLTQEERAVFYSQGLRPAIVDLAPDQADEWPVDLQGEIFRGTKTTGTMAYQTKILPDFYNDTLMDTVRAQLRDNQVLWGEDSFVMYTIRGTKHGTQHQPNENAAYQILQDYGGLELPYQVILDSIEETQHEEREEDRNQFYIDIGMEFTSVTNRCLQWRTTSHYHLAHDILDISEANASRMTQLWSSKYSRDISSHLPGVSGCRIVPGTHTAGPKDVVYLQAYTTDKSHTYNPEGYHHGKSITLKTAMSPKQPITFAEKLFDLYGSARDTVASNCRVEIRVPFQHASTALLEANTFEIHESMLSFPREVWWSWKSYRLLALSYILSLQATNDSNYRVMKETLLLTAASVWLINSLHARPDDGSAHRSLMLAALPRTEGDCDQLIAAYNPHLQANPAHVDLREEEEEEEDGGLNPIPYYPYGAIFLRRIKLEIVPRMRTGGADLTDAAFKFLFQKPYQEIQNQYNPQGFLPRIPVPQERIVTNKTQRTEQRPPEPNQQQEPLFHLADHGVALSHPPIPDTNSDMEVDDSSDDDGGQPNIDKVVTDLFRQFLADILIKSPNPKGRDKASYCHLDHDARLGATEDIYHDPIIANVWAKCQYKSGSSNDFDRIFRHLFPEYGHQTSYNVQNYRQCTYYRDWKRLCAEQDRRTCNAIRKQIRKRLKAFAWLPDASQDRIWSTKYLNGFSPFPSTEERSSAAPRIIFFKKTPVTNERIVIVD